jgi:hypothetical protein
VQLLTFVIALAPDIATIPMSIARTPADQGSLLAYLNIATGLLLGVLLLGAAALLATHALRPGSWSRA